MLRVGRLRASVRSEYISICQRDGIACPTAKTTEAMPRAHSSFSFSCHGITVAGVCSGKESCSVGFSLYLCNVLVCFVVAAMFGQLQQTEELYGKHAVRFPPSFPPPFPHPFPHPSPHAELLLCISWEDHEVLLIILLVAFLQPHLT